MANFIDNVMLMEGFYDIFGMTDDEGSDFEGFREDEIEIGVRDEFDVDANAEVVDVLPADGGEGTML